MYIKYYEEMKRKGYDGLDRIVLVMHRRGRASEVVDLVNFQENRLDNVVPDELKPGVPEMVHQILLPPREEVIHHDHAVPSLDQTVHEVATHEAGPTSHQNPQGLPFQPQRHSPTHIHVAEPERWMVMAAALLDVQHASSSTGRRL